MCRADGNPINVLVVDDEAVLAEMVSMALRYEGWTIATAGDGSSAIAAASILAKTWRDAWMAEADTRNPRYGFSVHKGYGTPQHLAALDAFGPCSLHRRTFAPVTQRLRWVS